MKSSVFGKTMENIRIHKDMKLVTSDKKYLTYVMEPIFKEAIYFRNIYLLWRWEKPR